MPSTELPETLNFLKQAERNISLQGSWPIARLNRLQNTLNTNKGELVASLNFSATGDFYCLKGTVKADLDVVCQRCFEPMQQALQGHFKFALVTDKTDHETLPPDMELYLVEGEEQSVIDILEDELLLLMPMVTMHQSECSEFLRKQKEQALREDTNKDNPFAVLKDLKID
jgi:uncharacterized protein